MRLFFIGSLAIGLSLPSAATSREVGGCRFDTQRMQFFGNPAAQTRCLLKRVKTKGAGADVQNIPAWLSDRVGAPTGPLASKIISYLQRSSIDSSTLSGLILDGNAPRLRYFVIHDTSAPELQQPAFPANINEAAYSGNRLSGWASLSGRVNLLISRDGRSRLTTDWGATRSRPATKIEQNSIAAAARPLFAHVENIQPRLKPSGSWAWIAPSPGFAPAQDDRLALAYVIASARAGRWLVPAYHFNIDQGLPDGHDDPQNADLAGWVARIERIHQEILAVP